MDYSLPGSSVHGILQASILEWVAIFSSRRSSLPRDQTHVSCIFCIGRQIIYNCATWEALYNGICCCSVAQLCPLFATPKDFSMPSFPVLHHFLEFVQTQVHWVSDAIQLSCPLSSPSPAFNPSQIKFFLMSRLFPSGGQSIRALASASVLPMNIQVWFPLGLTGLISLQSKRLSKVFSNTTVQKHQSVLILLYGPTLTSVYDYWKNHGFYYTDLCQ